MESVSELPTRVVIVDDDIVVSEIMALSISKDRGLSLVGIAHTAGDAAKFVYREHPDVILLNYRKSGENYAAIVRELSEQSPDSRIVLVSGLRNQELDPDATVAGCVGIVGRDSSIAEILRAIRRAARRELVTSTSRAVAHR
ncbi:MAG TPA: response regulator [Acidimicrobiales bacterium]|jgi:DNA-binding NarL/FixJ family response regulator